MDDNSNEKTYKPIFTWCKKELDSCNSVRRCFMTGEYCSKQDTIQKDRETLHDNDCINAFVVMNFSNASDVVYRWRLRSFIETLGKDLYFSKDKTRLYCISRIEYNSKDIGDNGNSNGHRPLYQDEVIKVCHECGLKYYDLEKEYNDLKSGNNLPEFDSFMSQLPIHLKAAKALALELKTSEKTDNIATLERNNNVAIVNLLMQLFSPTYKNGPLIPVKAINVIRADSDPSTNFVICNRVCQQLQIADLIVVDVSITNANVFYELGMAVAMDKMILPICYSESFFKMGTPEKLNKLINENEANNKFRGLEHHIGCFEWRRELFEHFGIRYRSSSSKTKYHDYKYVINTRYGFEDKKYSEFPYCEEIAIPESMSEKEDIEPKRIELNMENKGNKLKRGPIGECIYEKLRYSYNESSENENTLVVYTMDKFLNPNQAALCIVNYYNAIVRQFRSSKCFCGERVGVLLQGDVIHDDPKDGTHPPIYDVGRIIQIGTNQATYKAHIDIVKPDDFLTDDLESNVEKLVNELDKDNKYKSYSDKVKHLRDNLILATKDFIRNRAMPVYPLNPFYVERITDGTQKDLFNNIDMFSSTYDGDSELNDMAGRFYCLFHVMLRTLRFTNEIVVDIGKNSMQSLFWLGIAHGSDTNAITVRHEVTDRERQLANSNEKKHRFIFDVAGLWTAVYRDDASAEDFYNQLASAQSGIEQYSRLILKSRSKFNEKVDEEFWQPKEERYAANATVYTDLHMKKEKEEDDLLESYYRSRAWRAMLRNNKLKIYLRQEKLNDTKKYEPRPAVLKWDVEAAGMLSNYLTRKKTIGEYQIVLLEYQKADPDGKSEGGNYNFVCIGSEAGPVYGDEKHKKDAKETEETTIIKQLNSLISGYFVYEREPYATRLCCNEYKSDADVKPVLQKGYFGTQDECYMTQIPSIKCVDCLKSRTDFDDSISLTRQILLNKNDLTSCIIKGLWKELSDTESQNSKYSHFHLELARLLLWRKEKNTSIEKVNANIGSNSVDPKEYYFRVVLSGASGPATKAIASLFVDSTHKGIDPEKLLPQKAKAKEQDGKSGNEEEYNGNWDMERKTFYGLNVCVHPLLDLQTRIRKEFMLHYCKILKSLLPEVLRISHAPEKEQTHKKIYVEQLIGAATVYLSTVLYRYFLPFLSTEDIERMCNGMKMYVSSLQKKDCSPFSLHFPKYVYDPTGDIIEDKDVRECSNKLSEILRITLENLIGVEAYYCAVVKDEFDSHNSDKRQIIGITDCPDKKNAENNEEKEYKLKLLLAKTAEELIKEYKNPTSDV